MSRLLPPSPSLEQLKKQAKSLLKRLQTADPEALTRIRENHPRWRTLSEEQVAASPFALADAQLVIASEYGFASWSKLQSHVKTLEAASSTAAAVASLRDAAQRGDLARIDALLDAHPELIDERGGEGVRTPLHQRSSATARQRSSCCLSAALIPTSAAKVTTRIRSISPWRSIAFPSFVSWWNMGRIRSAKGTTTSWV
jgi:hypothetical protein